MNKRQQIFPSIVIGLCDLLIVNAAFVISYYLRFVMELSPLEYPKAPFEEYVKALLLVNYIYLFLFTVFGFYKKEPSTESIVIINRIVKAVSIGTVFLVSLTFFYREFSYSRLVVLYSWAISIIGISLYRILLGRLERFLMRKGKYSKQSLIIGSGQMANMLVEKLKSQPELGFRIVDTIAVEKAGDHQGEGMKKQPLEQLKALMEKHQINTVFIAEPSLSHFDLLEIINTCEEHDLNIILVPAIYDLLINYSDLSTLNGIPLVSLSERPLSTFSLIVKRVFDILFSLGVIILTLPFYPLIALAISLDSKGPVFFRQRRAGLDGKEFTMIKFRTMVVDAEKRLRELVDMDNLPEPVFKLKEDPRITRVGRFLRRFSLDELPQFFNVLIGEMSVVGPRPEETELVKQYNVWQKRRLKIRPGITGLQQITCRGTTSLAERVKYDVYYIRRQSLVLDLYIILKTLLVIISGKGYL